ncbi:YdgA family protein [Xenorhabdus bovienii]|uniref:YdgA family protein n=1 Tax=Xenorhabdus bovienii TaxID=40576 RepID=UPI00237CAB35|nr:YdgA family protein [Xenorhabdus bovienii]MDE1481555.1 YdgA family protein [Xenorhabdus bovienii]MDE9457106.1 YdgA family protein [Xenorhabdus bovienii]MDE9485006.1 YdgA family protein [Xenorhabdus bovienii]MDE9513100.1 YdgA family protein [Xenorhabdus bovienii]
MKKSLVAVGVIVALGAAWTGASWYTGKQIEGRLNNIIKTVNIQLAKSFPESAIELQTKDFQRGVFSSDVRLILKIKDGVKNADIKPNEEIIFKSSIGHGPLPISDLKKLNLVPKMASIHSELEQSEATKALFEATKGKSLLTMGTKIGYSSSLSTDIDFIPVDYTAKNGNKLVFSGAKIDAEIARDLSNFKFNVKSDRLIFSSPSKHEELTLKGIDFKGDNKKGKFDLYLGDQNYNIDEITLSSTSDDSFSLKGMKITSKVGETDKNLNLNVSYGIDGLKLKNMDLGSGQLVIGMNNLDGQSVRKFSQAYNDATAKALTSEALSTDSVSNKVIENAHLLFNNSPQFSLEPMKWKNSKGESSVNFKLALKNIPENKDSLILMGPEEMLRTLLQELSLDVKIPKPMLIESITQAKVLDGKTKEAAEAEATQEVQMIASQGVSFKILTDENNVIGLKLHYANDKVELNNKKSDLHQFLLDNHLIGS